MTPADAQAMVNKSPYLRWLGIQVLSVADDAVEVKATWREEWVAHPEVRQTQGGILGALIDFTADFALINRLGKLVPTIDMRVDYHRMAKQGDLRITGKVVKFGRTISVCEATVYDMAGEMLASGRATYFTATK